MLYENTLKQFTNDVKHTDDPTSTLKLLLQEKTERMKINCRLNAFEETMKRNNITLEKIPELLMEHNHLMNFYNRAKEHFDVMLPVAYRAQNIVKRCTKLIQFGDSAFPEFVTCKTDEDLLETVTEDRFIELVNEYKFRESQIMDLQERANEFKFNW